MPFFCGYTRDAVRLHQREHGSNPTVDHYCPVHDTTEKLVICFGEKRIPYLRHSTGHVKAGDAKGCSEGLLHLNAKLSLAYHLNSGGRVDIREECRSCRLQHVTTIGPFSGDGWCATAELALGESGRRGDVVVTHDNEIQRIIEVVDTHFTCEPAREGLPWNEVAARQITEKFAEVFSEMQKVVAKSGAEESGTEENEMIIIELDCCRVRSGDRRCGRDDVCCLDRLALAEKLGLYRAESDGIPWLQCHDVTSRQLRTELLLRGRVQCYRVYGWLEHTPQRLTELRTDRLWDLCARLEYCIVCQSIRGKQDVDGPLCLRCSATCCEAAPREKCYRWFDPWGDLTTAESGAATRRATVALAVAPTEVVGAVCYVCQTHPHVPVCALCCDCLFRDDMTDDLVLNTTRLRSAQLESERRAETEKAEIAKAESTKAETTKEKRETAPPVTGWWNVPKPEVQMPESETPWERRRREEEEFSEKREAERLERLAAKRKYVAKEQARKCKVQKQLENGEGVATLKHYIRRTHTRRISDVFKAVP